MFSVFTCCICSGTQRGTRTGKLKVCNIARCPATPRHSAGGSLRHRQDAYGTGRGRGGAQGEGSGGGISQGDPPSVMMMRRRMRMIMMLVVVVVVVVRCELSFK